MLQHGAYTLLLDACYDREQFPTLEDAIEWTWASSAEEVAAVEFVLSRFFALENGRYVQKRIQEEIESFKEKSKKNQEIALEREAARRERKARNTHELARNVHESPPNHKPLTTNQDINLPTVDSQQQAACPHQELIEIYHQQMPNNPAVKVWNEKRQRYMRARWNENLKAGRYADKAGGLDFWKRFFAYCNESPFLTGQVPRKDAPPFIADMEWLITPGNYAKVIEGKYNHE